MLELKNYAASLINLLVEELCNGDLLASGTAGEVVPGLDLLPDCSLTRLLADELLCFFECVDQRVDSLVQLAQVSLHVLLLALGVLGLLISMEGFKVFFVVGHHAWRLATSHVVRKARGVVTHGLASLLLLSVCCL